jgi:hypothetical protein
MKMTDKEAGKVLHALRQAQIEFTTLASRLPEPYRSNVKGCAEDCKKAIVVMQDVRARGEDGL